MPASTQQEAPLADRDEIARFNALAASWWDPNGPMKPLHRLNPMRIGFLKEAFAAHFGRDGKSMQPFGGLNLLDIGCGAGLVAEPMARLGFEVAAIDLAEENIAAAKSHAALEGLTIDYRATPIEKLPDTPVYDAITLLEVVEHVPDVPAFVAEAAKRLKPGGMLIASTLNRTLKAYALAIFGAEYVLRWLPVGTHDWNKFVTPDELDRAFAEAGLQPNERAGMVFNPLADSWRLSNDCDVNYLVSATKPD
ncbi:MAG TPA: bifunctional 2-polyprenyl-6-hydroxyphenol methylase/3-demethylubiquinol 3-O-methyltransferase UbiG [Rhabdaerophilum sp.]|nr:bifunctional 2-polyprenyl-6-hydroxyphenol methylase/3-demethylubiquinol 3-O-methyltransferase UbiG [Rhabdaerophilum sp.]